MSTAAVESTRNINTFADERRNRVRIDKSLIKQVQNEGLTSH